MIDKKAILYIKINFLRSPNDLRAGSKHIFRSPPLPKNRNLLKKVEPELTYPYPNVTSEI